MADVEKLKKLQQFKQGNGETEPQDSLPRQGGPGIAERAERMRELRGKEESLFEERQAREAEDQVEPFSFEDFTGAAETFGLGAGSIAGGLRGARTGAMLGAPLGPGGMALGTIGGTAIGGALGAGAGSQLDQLLEGGRNVIEAGRRAETPGEALQNIAKATFVEQQADSPTLEDNAREALREGFLDLTFTAGTPVVSTALRSGARGLTRTLGVRAQGDELAKAADDLGISLGTVDVAEPSGGGAVTEFFPRVLGRFPFLGGPIRSAAKRKARELSDAEERLFLRIGPTMNMADLGFQIDQAATKKFDAFRKVINERYKSAFEIARQTDASMSAEPLQRTAKQALAEVQSKRGRLPQDSEVVRFVRNEIDTLPDSISLDRYDGLMQELDKALGQAQGFERRLLAGVKSAGERALTTIDNPKVARRIQETDKLFGMTMDLFGSPTAKRLGRARAGRFEAGRFSRPGSRNPSELFRITFDFESPEAMQELRALTDDETFNSAFRGFLDQTFDDISRSVTGGSPSKAGVKAVQSAKQQLGLADKRSARFRSLQEAMKSTNASPKELEDLLNSAEAVFNRAPDDINQFIARRGTIGGLRSISGALTPSAPTAGQRSIDATLASTLGTLMVSRTISRVLASPKLLRASRNLMEPGKNFQETRGALVTLIRGLGLEDEIFGPVEGVQSRRPQQPQGQLRREGSSGPQMRLR